MYLEPALLLHFRFVISGRRLHAWSAFAGASVCSSLRCVVCVPSFMLHLLCWFRIRSHQSFANSTVVHIRLRFRHDRRNPRYGTSPYYQLAQCIAIHSMQGEAASDNRNVFIENRSPLHHTALSVVYTRLKSCYPVHAVAASSPDVDYSPSTVLYLLLHSFSVPFAAAFQINDRHCGFKHRAPRSMSRSTQCCICFSKSKSAAQKIDRETHCRSEVTASARLHSRTLCADGVLQTMSRDHIPVFRTRRLG